MIKEIGSRWDSLVLEGLSAEKETNVCALVEMKVEKDGKIKYLTGEWIESAPGTIVFEVTDQPVLDMLAYREGSPEELQEIRDNAEVKPYISGLIAYEGEYEEQYQKVVDMIREVLVKKVGWKPEGDWAF